MLRSESSLPLLAVELSLVDLLRRPLDEAACLFFVAGIESNESEQTCCWLEFDWTSPEESLVKVAILLLFESPSACRVVVGQIS